jgi:2-keto-4-pentenoate hydratase/2-oxohepta-3-ene-1,7-dioic acid hydratase in catechol pathway
MPPPVPAAKAAKPAPPLQISYRIFSIEWKGKKLRLMRIGSQGSEKPVVLVSEDSYVDVSDLTPDFDESFFGSGGIDRIRPEVAKRLAEGKTSLLKGERIGAPFARPHQIVCIGLNYRDHAEETGATVPDEPIIFTKTPNTLIGPNDTVLIPKKSKKTDWEVELGVLVGKQARYIESPEAAREFIAGYVLVNDVSEREFQLERQGQWSKGKSSETFNPAGPYLVTTDEVKDVTNLKMTLELNGEIKQNSSTNQMVFTPDFLVYYLSQFMVLEPGDLINTGTPPGVGLGHKPELYLKPGDVMKLSIEGLGTAEQTVAQAS